MSDTAQQKLSFELWSFPFLENSINEMEPPQIAEPVNDNELVLSEELPDAAENKSHLVTESLVLPEHIQYLDGIGLEMKQVLSEFDGLLLTNMLTLIKKTVKKIILKEISLDENTIKDMVTDSLDQIHNNDELCVVSISAEDAAIFEKSTSLNHVAIKVDQTLLRGDYIIKTKYSQIDAILEQRLNRLFGI
jgi:hypothetical protein